MHKALTGIVLLLCVPAFAQETPVRKVTLEEALALAEAKNPSIVVAAAEARRAEAIVRSARSQTLPAVDANAGYTRFDKERRLGGQVISPAGVGTASLGVNIPILSRVAWAEWAHAKDQELIARYQAQATRRQIAVSIGHAYLGVIAQHRQIEIAERARDNAMQHYDYTHKRFDGGASSRLDLVRAEQELRSNESNVESIRIGLRAAQEALGILACEEEPLDSAADPVFDVPATVDPAALSEREDVRVALERKRAARKVYDDSWNDWIPSVFGDVREYYQTPSTASTPNNSWQASLGVSIPIFDAGFRRAAAAQRLALSEEAATQADAVARSAASELRFALDEERRASIALESAKAAASLAHEALDIATQSYELGATTNIEVLDAERRARDADSLAESAEDALRQARLDVRAAAGLFPGGKS